MLLKPNGHARRVLCFWGLTIPSAPLAHAEQCDVTSMVQSRAAVQQPSGFRPLAASTAAAALSAADTACNNSDRAVWSSKGQQAFISDIDACGWKCWGKATCVKSCIMQKEPYSDTCATCFGSFGQCAGIHCPFDCADAYSGKCRTCVKAHCAQAFTTCSGFTTPEAPPALAEQAAVAVAASCNDGDRAVWYSKGRKAFVSDINGCSWKCWGRPACVASCVRQKEPYSGACAACFGSFGQCARDNCRFACRDAYSETCKKCIKPHCAPAFGECTGFD